MKPYAATTFQNTYSRPMHVFTSNEEDPSLYPRRNAFLSSLIGNFTATVINHVREVHPNAVSKFSIHRRQPGGSGTGWSIFRILSGHRRSWIA
jgi:hypothetical protein